MRYLYLILYSLCFYYVNCLIDQKRSTFGSHQLITYVTDWDVPKFIPWDKLDHIAYAFAIPDKNGTLVHFDKEKLQKIVEDSHKHGKGVSIAVGGWTGSINFSDLTRTSVDRRGFAKKLVEFVQEYNLNGINIDWEYPNDPSGIPCNGKHPKDIDNLLALIQILRGLLDEAFPNEHILITTAVNTQGFRDVNRHYVSVLDQAWANFVDAFYVMAYDVNGVYSNYAAANAPLHYGSTGQNVSIDSSINYWLQAGIPAERLYLGVPFFGYTHKTLKHITYLTGMNVTLDRTIPQIQGDKYDTAEADPCPGAQPLFSGEIQWRTIDENGAALNASGWSTFWDQITQTPYAYNEKNNQFITFDSPASLRLKTEFAKEKSLGGIMVWSLEMDDSSNSLLNALQGVRT